MKQAHGWYLPDHETHLQGWMQKVNDKVDGKLRYQGSKLDTAMSFCNDFRYAVDIGAHVGLFSYWLSRRFDAVFAFEPSAEQRACFEKNVTTWPSGNVKLLPMALGESPGKVGIKTTKGSSGDTHVAGPGEIEMSTLDSIIPQDVPVDFIKIDTEGMELPIIKGAKQTILRCRPVMMVEQKGHEVTHFGFEKEGAIKYLKELGMKPLCKPNSGDWFMGW